MSDPEDLVEVPFLEDREDADLEDEQTRRGLEDADLEDEIARFRDKPPIQHDIYPECESEDDEEEVVHKKFDLQAYGSKDSPLFKGQFFFNCEEFAQAVLEHALKTGCNIRQYRYDKDKIGFNCVGANCNWRIYCVKVPMRSQWEVRVHVDQHSCIPNGDCDMLKVPLIARLFLDKIRHEPEYFMPMKIQELIKEKWNMIVTRGQCQTARRKALRWLEAEYDMQFQRLRNYAAELLLSNPGSSVEVETLTNDEGLDTFNRFYVCFENVKRTWKDTCRPLLGVDGCFLRSKMKGQLLSAIGRDANNVIYPVAWAVVQVENKPNWLWFLRRLKTYLGIIAEGEGYVLVSDRHKGLLEAVKLVLPKIEHRNCVRHIYSNLKKRHGEKSRLTEMVWGLAWSYNEAEYKANLQKIRVYDSGVFQDVMNTEPMTWCRAFYKVGSHCEDVENNSTESFNATIVRARYKALVPMLELISRQTMVRIFNRSIIARKHEGLCTPYVQGKLAKEFPMVSECRVYNGTNYMNLVLYNGSSFQVCLGTRTCSCKRWEIRGFLCVHAYAVILDKKYLVENFVSDYFRTNTWRKTYTNGIIPARGAAFWPDAAGAPIHRPLSPPQPGRKKKSKKQKRKKGMNESPTKRKKKRIMHCGVCGSSNNNSRYHKNRGDTSEALEASQSGTSQALEASQEGTSQALEASQGGTF